MKALWIPVFLTIIGLALPAQGQTFAQPSFVTPNGEKKVGQYVWVWRTVTVKGSTTIETDCPVGYAVVGGGYNKGPVEGSYPNSALTGWVVTAFASGMFRETVYAGCAPTS